MAVSYTVSAQWLHQDADVFSIEIDRRAGNIFEQPQVGRCVMRLDNTEGDYAPPINRVLFTNSDTAIQTNSSNDILVDVVVLNSALDVTATDSAGTVHSLFSGTVDRIEQNPAPGEEMAIIEASDIARNLRRTVNVPLSIDIHTASLASVVLSEAGISTTSVDPINDVIPFSLVDDVSAGTMLRRLMRSGAHFTFVAGDGTFIFRDRNFDLQQAVTSSLDQFSSYRHIVNDERLMNDVRISGAPREATTNVQTIAWLNQTPTVAASSEISFFLEFIDPANREVRTPANSVASPVNSTDYTLNTQADGGGSDLTSTASASTDVFARSAKVTVFNGAGQEANVTKFKMRGFPLRRTPEFTEQTEVSSSQARYGRYSFAIDNDLIPSRNFAKNYSAFMAKRYQDPIPDLRVSLKNEDPAILDLELLDKVHIVNTVTNVASDHSIFSANHRIQFSTVGREHVAEYGVRLSTTKNFLILDRDPEGKLDVRELGF